MGDFYQAHRQSDTRQQSEEWHSLALRTKEVQQAGPNAYIFDTICTVHNPPDNVRDHQCLRMIGCCINRTQSHCTRS